MTEEEAFKESLNLQALIPNGWNWIPGAWHRAVFARIVDLQNFLCGNADRVDGKWTLGSIAHLDGAPNAECTTRRRACGIREGGANREHRGS